MTSPAPAGIVVFLTALAALTLGIAAQTPRETRVNTAFDRLETDFIERLDVSESLSSGREDLALLIRKGAAVGRSWQLEPSVTAMLTTDEIFRFVVARANALLACRLAQLAGRDLAATPPQGTGRGASDVSVSERLWRGSLTEGNFRLSPGCNVLLDPDGQPASLTTKQEVDQSDRLMSRAPRTASRAQLFEAAVEPNLRPNADARLKSNLEYLRREYGGAPERQTEMETILSRKETQVFSRQVLMFEAFMSSTAAADRLILLVPLSQ